MKIIKKNRVSRINDRALTPEIAKFLEDNGYTLIGKPKLATVNGKKV